MIVCHVYLKVGNNREYLCCYLIGRVFVVSADLCELFHNEFLKCHGPFVTQIPSVTPTRLQGNRATGLSSIQ